MKGWVQAEQLWLAVQQPDSVWECAVRGGLDQLDNYPTLWQLRRDYCLIRSLTGSHVEGEEAMPPGERATDVSSLPNRDGRARVCRIASPTPKSPIR